jgi:hypothetical protein
MPTYDLSNARWRKSSRSGSGNNADCVEVALLDVEWRKSSRSGSGNNANCVEIALARECAAIRDSKNPGRALVLPVEALRALLMSADR